MNINEQTNFRKLNLSFYILPLLLLVLIVILLNQNKALNVIEYINIQKDWFYYLNKKLAQFPQLQYNFTQLGDAFIFLSILTFLIVKIPKIWHILITSCLVSAVLSKVLKVFFSVPRPAAVFAHDTFIIIGKPITSTTSSLPSGHSITVFTILTVLFFAFYPQKNIYKFFFTLIFLILGLILAFSRVGVGAHFPLDVIIGSVIGYISGISGILIQKKYKLFQWIGTKKYHPFFILLFLICIFLIVKKINEEDLFIFYLSLAGLVYSLFLILKEYVKK